MDPSAFKPEYISNYSDAGCTYGYYTSSRKVYPFTYLEYARADEADGDDPRNLVNAVGNAKRAFHYQVESLCDALGWKALHGSKHANFAKYLDYLGACGVLSPNILRKLNATRNKVEHDYHIPTSDEVGDYIDVVELFLMATKDLLNRFPDQLTYELMHDEFLDEALGLPEHLIVDIEMNDGGITISYDRKKQISYSVKDSDYFSWLSSIIKSYVRG
jgi:hypothetical protein